MGQIVVLGWFYKRLNPRAAAGQRPPTTVVLYLRDGCHLCHEAHELLVQRQGHYSFTLKLIDVDRDSDLKTRHGERVPVVAVNGRERFHGRLNPALLDRLLSREAGPNAS